MIPARPTMNHVAREAGVSLKTVSRVVNGELGVREETVERVEAAIRRLQYRRNDIASTLRRRGTSASIGLVIEDLANPFYSLVARAVEDAASERQSVLITGSSEGSPLLERQLIGVLIGRRVDGLIVVPEPIDHSFLLRDLRAGTPVVFLDRPPAGLEADSVVLDNCGGAQLAVAHLIAEGHRRIAIVGDPESLWTASERLRGYRAELAAAGIGEDPSLIRLGSRAVGDAERMTRELLALPSPPTAIFAANNRNCIGVLRGLGDRRDGVVVVGFDDFELADMLGVSVVAYDPAELGARAARRLFARIDGDDAPAGHEVLATRLIVRGSPARKAQPLRRGTRRPPAGSDLDAATPGRAAGQAR
jgi:LacI family transcriptional regulator